MEIEKKTQLYNLLLSYNLTSIINFQTRVQNTSAITIDNILLAYLNLKVAVTPILNGLSDHDVQLLMISTDCYNMAIRKHKTVRKINKISTRYLTVLIYEAMHHEIPSATVLMSMLCLSPF